MILSHRALTSVNMSSYQAIWTHFRQISMIFEQINILKFIYLTFQISREQVLIRRGWPSRQHAQVCLVLCIPFGCALFFVPGIASIPFWKPLTCGYLAQGLFFQKNMPHFFLEAPDLWVRCSRLSLSQKNGAPIVLEAPNLWVLCSRLFFQK